MEKIARKYYIHTYICKALLFEKPIIFYYTNAVRVSLNSQHFYNFQTYNKYLIHAEILPMLVVYQFTLLCDAN